MSTAISITRKRPRAFSNWDNLLKNNFEGHNVGSLDDAVIVLDSEDPNHDDVESFTQQEEQIQELLAKPPVVANNFVMNAMDPVGDAFQLGPSEPSSLGLQEESKEEEAIDDRFDFKDFKLDLDANYVPSKRFKKQRTISLPQLPHAKILYLPSMVPQEVPKPNIKPRVVCETLLRKRETKDKNGHYLCKLNETVANGRFVVKKLLGQGTFGKVLACVDNTNGDSCAIKIIRAVDKYREAAKIELRVLATLQQADLSNQFQCIQLREALDYEGHICFVSDLLDLSLFDFMKKNQFFGFPGSHVQAIARQLIRSVCFMHDLNIVHTDLKPENVLLCDAGYNRKRHVNMDGKATFKKILKSPEIKVIDFGSAVFSNEYHPAVISTRHYRAPEIVMGLGWSFECDMWSIGCILVELVTGEALYATHDSVEHLAMMRRIKNMEIPKEMVHRMFDRFDRRKGNLPADLKDIVPHFDRIQYRLEWPTGETSDKSYNRVCEKLDRLDWMLSDKIGLRYRIDSTISFEDNCSLSQGLVDRETLAFWYFFIHLVNGLLEFDPQQRLSARDAFEHEWFNYGILDEGTVKL